MTIYNFSFLTSPKHNFLCPSIHEIVAIFFSEEEQTWHCFSISVQSLYHFQILLSSNLFLFHSRSDPISFSSSRIFSYLKQFPYGSFSISFFCFSFDPNLRSFSSKTFIPISLRPTLIQFQALYFQSPSVPIPFLFSISFSRNLLFP